MDKYDYGAGVLLKLPFTTNQRYKTCKTPDKCYSRLIIIVVIFETYAGVIPYCMLQPTLENRMEYTVVCFNGTPLYIANVGGCGNVGKGRLPFSNAISLKLFAANAITILSNHCPHALLSGLVRVDLMYNEHLNKIVINEFESLEAMYSSTKVRNVEFIRRTPEELLAEHFNCFNVKVYNN
jgi:hypothetical protein